VNDLCDETEDGNAINSAASFAIRWIEPDTVELREGPYGSLVVAELDGTMNRSVFAMRCFPAAHPDDFISLRTWNEDGDEHELGIVRHLELWSKPNRELMRVALSRRYFLRRITGVDSIKLEYGHLLFDVRTDQGPARFTMRWTHSQAQDFGVRGKVLVDVEDNRFLVPDTEDLPPRERDLLQRYVYW
jgi:hypothetical protein